MNPVGLQDFAPLPEGSDQFKLGFIEESGTIKLAEREGRAWIGCAREPSADLLKRIRFALKKELVLCQVDPSEFAEYVSRQAAEFGGQAEPDATDESNLLDRLANDAPIINLVNSILLEGLRLGASDIHLEGQAEGVRVRFRVDGLLASARLLPKDIAPGLSSRIKIMSNLNIIERRLPQDGKMNALVGDRTVEFRVSIMPTVEGESIVLRLFNRDKMGMELGGLGFDDHFLERLRGLMRYPHGLILVTGPTGSGKTTSLNAIMREINGPELKILTVEDPVENKIAGLCQVQTNEDIGMSFDSVLRRLLRQDPDVLMIGEIRDKATADLALRSALTGHQVWATLHTNDALSAVNRLLNMGLEAYLLAGVIRGVFAQRLVRRLCPRCSELGAPDAVEQAFLAENRRSPTRVPRAMLCDDCHQGYRGRVAMGEIFAFDEAAEEIVTRHGHHRDLVDHFASMGSPFLVDAGLDLVESGTTTIAEIQRVVYGL